VVKPNHEFVKIFSIGFRDKVAVLKKGVTKVIPNVDFMALDPEWDYSAYGWMDPTMFEVYKALLRYDVVTSDFPDVDPDVARDAFGLQLQLHAPTLNKGRVLEPHEVRTNSHSSSGPNNEFCGKKADCMQKYGPSYYFWWKMGYRLSLVPHWKMSGKVEVLKRSKLEAGDCRSFLFPDHQFLWCGQRICQHTNDLLDEDQSGWGAVGFDRTHGGFHQLGKTLSRGYVKFCGDVTKWDARFSKFLLWICMMLRWCFLAPQYRTPENWWRLVWLYTNKAKSVVVMPSGQYVYISGGNKSGQDSTSNDNTLGHEFIYLYETALVLRTRGIPVTLSAARRLWDLKLYG
jgi:hypothetical protein